MAKKDKEKDKLKKEEHKEKERDKAKEREKEQNKNDRFPLPDGWMQAGSNPREYDMGVCTAEFHSGDRCGILQSNTDKLHGFGTLMQMFAAGEFKNNRVRLTGWVKSKDVSGWAGMWMRVDGEQGHRGDYLAFDNMQDRPILRETDWAKYEIVLDVPDKSSNIAFGVLLNGAGAVWMDDFSFEIVDRSVPLTGNAHKQRQQPHNLDFSQS